MAPKISDLSQKKGEKSVTKKKASTIPSFQVLVMEALSELDNRKGSSLIAIKKFVEAHHAVDQSKCRRQISAALKKGLFTGSIRQVRGTAVTGSFRAVAPISPMKSKSVKRNVEKTTTKKTFKKSPLKILKEQKLTVKNKKAVVPH